jgi:hypothetical protein
VKSVVITLTIDIPETELNKDGKLVIGTAEYTGKVTAIIAHEVQIVPTTKVTLQAPGLEIVPP